MRGRYTIVLALGLAVGACSGLESLTEPLSEQVAIETLDLPGRLWDPFMPSPASGVPVTIQGLLTIPATEVPVPAVIIAHGCGGVSGGELGWIPDLEAVGIATLVIDSFRARGIESICSGEQTINVASPIVDVYRAADLLAANPYIDDSKIAVMGLSFGGRAALWSALTRFQETYHGRPFAAYVAFYPSTCYIRLRDEAVVTGGPIRIFHGTADDWTPIDQCREMIDRLKTSGVDAALYTYQGAPHAFDNKSLAWAQIQLDLDFASPRNCTFIEEKGSIIDPQTSLIAGVDSPCVERGVHYGYDSAAREAAKEDLIALLGGVFDDR